MFWQCNMLSAAVGETTNTSNYLSFPPPPIPPPSPLVPFPSPPLSPSPPLPPTFPTLLSSHPPRLPPGMPLVCQPGQTKPLQHCSFTKYQFWSMQGSCPGKSSPTLQCEGWSSSGIQWQWLQEHSKSALSQLTPTLLESWDRQLSYSCVVDTCTLRELGQTAVVLLY